MLALALFSFSSYSTKWVYHSLYFDSEGNMYAVEECVSKFLSTDGCQEGLQRMVPIDTV